MNSYPELRLYAARQNHIFFAALLQSGVEYQTRVGTPLMEFLCTLPGFTPDYVEERAQTVFVDGTPLDHLEQPLVGAHPVVALSAAMPGLAGAIFRRGGMHASLRSSQMPDGEEGGDVPAGSPLPVTVKLFNSILQEKGPGLLRSGVVVPGDVPASFFARRPEVAAMVQSAALAGRELSMESLGRYDLVELVLE